MVFLIGGGDMARELIMIFNGPWAIVDPHAQERVWHDVPIYTRIEEAVQRHGARPYMPAVAEPRVKRRIMQEAAACALPLAPALIHPQAYVHPSAGIAAGCAIYPGACISHSTVLEECVSVLFQCSVGHDVRLGALSTLSPAVAISGNVTVGPRVFFGTNCAVRQGVTIGEGCRVGMGSILVEDLPAHTNALTNPRLIKLAVEDR
jgi:sugar O-acyltransferase (sialic acid O-acetyltransferase NeuD family)